MKQGNLLPKEWLEKWGCRPMTLYELKLLQISDNDAFEYYVCEDWLKYLLNFVSFETLTSELNSAISVDFEVKVATKQRQSIKTFKKPKVLQNLERGRQPDIRNTLRSGMARYRNVVFEKSVKKISSRKINPFCSFANRFKAKEKIYSLLTTQDDTERVFINFVACATNAVSKESKRNGTNGVIWFKDLDFDMFKAQRKNFYPIISHNLAMAYCLFINKVAQEERDYQKPNASVCFAIKGVENLQDLIR